MPRKNKPRPPEPQALRLPSLKLSDAALEALRGSFQVGASARTSMKEIADAVRGFGEWATRHGLRLSVPPHALGEWRARSTEPPAQIKQTKWRKNVPHAAEAIDQMLSERESNPSLRLVKAQVDRVKVILRKKYRHCVADSQSRTIRRMIKERAALKRQSEQG